MNSLNKLAITNLKLNKKRSIMTTIGIVLATALICAASNMFTSAQATLVDATIAQGGYYHVKLSDLTKDDVQKLEANRDIKDFGNLTKNEKQILDIIVNNPQITQASIANQVQRGIATLKKNRIVERVGSNKKRHWKIIGKGDR